MHKILKVILAIKERQVSKVPGPTQYSLVPSAIASGRISSVFSNGSVISVAVDILN